MTVLIMEDDVAYGYALSRTLSAIGRTPVLCKDWQEYLSRIETDRDIRSVVLDVKLPAGTPNGLTLARMTHYKRPDMRVVVMSSDPDLLHNVPMGAIALEKSASLAEIAAAANN